MGKGKGKWKKQATVAANEQAINSGEEKVPLKRGRPRKIVKKEIEEKEEPKITEEEVIQNEKAAEEIEKKRKASSEIEGSLDPAEEENGENTSATVNDSVKLGFRQSGSRRKNKPRRAADVGVECFCY